MELLPVVVRYGYKEFHSNFRIGCTTKAIECTYDRPGAQLKQAKTELLSYYGDTDQKGKWIVTLLKSCLVAILAQVVLFFLGLPPVAVFFLSMGVVFWWLGKVEGQRRS